MAYKNQKGENLYMFGWLEAPAGTTGNKDFQPTTGGIMFGRKLNVRQFLKLIEK